jgi:hypothetical protein
MSGALSLESLLGMTAAPQAQAPLPQAGYLPNLLTSAIRSGTSEMVGLPGEWVQGVTGVSPQQNDAWRNENWWSSLGSQLVGGSVPYIAAAVATPPLAATSTAARLLPSIANLYSREAMLSRPVATTLGRFAAEVVPFEAARLAATPMLGGDLEEVAASAGINLAATGLLGAAFGGLRALRSGAASQEIERLLADRVDGYNINAPPQEQLDALTRALPNFETNLDLRRLMEANIESASLRVRIEEPKGQTFLGDLEGLTQDRVSKDLNRLFRWHSSKEGELRVSTLSNTASGYDSQAAWRAVVDEIGLPERWDTITQFPRVVEPLNVNQADRINSNLEKALIDVGDGWYIRRQANDDMFVLARKLQNNRWFITRTNDPNAIVPNAPAFRRNERLSRFVGGKEDDVFRKAALAQVEDAAGTPVLKNSQEMTDAMPALTRVDRARWDMLELVGNKLGNPTKEYRETAGSMWQGIKNVAAPAMAQFSKAPLASWVYTHARSTFEMAQGRGRRWLYGDVKVDGAPVKALFRGATAQGGLRGSFEQLRQADVPALTRFWYAQTYLRQELPDAIKYALDGIDPSRHIPIRTFLDDLMKVQGSVLDEILATEAAVGQRLSRRDDLYGFAHVWPGEWRQRVIENNKTVFIAGGYTKEQAYQTAKKWAERNGARLDPNGPFMSDREGDLQTALELLRARRTAPTKFKATEPSNLERRQKTPVGGYIGDPDLPAPKLEELWKVLENDIQTKMQNIASLVIERRYNKGMMAEIATRHGQGVANALATRMNDMAGRQTAVSRWQNKALSSLDPVLGKNSATKIAGGWNAVETHFNLFFGNIGYVAANALSFIQTVAPKLSLTRQMLARGESSRAFALYDFAPALTTEGAKGAAAVMNPWKLAMGALRDMQSPSPEARQYFARAVREGAIAPKMFDEYLGENARIWTSVKKMAQGEEPVLNAARAAAGFNSYVPVKVEELTRGHTFFVGLRMAEAMGLQGEAAYQMGKQFTLRTMYGYAQSDRPRMFTGPTGMVFGLFKNWMFHYLADFGMYSREAMRGNFNGLLWATGGAATIGGLGGVPLYALIDNFQKMFTKEPLMQTLYEGVGDTRTGDALYFGLPALLGISMQGSASAPFNDPIRDITFMANVAALDRVQKIGKLGGEAWNEWARGGNNPLGSDRFWDLAAYALGPRTAYKAFAQVEEGALRSIRNGRPIIEGISDLEAGLNMVGLTPTRIARAWEVSDSLWSDQEKRKARTSAYADVYFQAMQRGDGPTMTNTITRAVEQGVDISAVMQGALQRQRDMLLPQMPFDYLRTPEGRGMDRLRATGLLD